eukprot:COSAG02_NODE_10206_length_1995_cov_22.563291_3_plen_173_part_00
MSPSPSALYGGALAFRKPAHSGCVAAWAARLADSVGSSAQPTAAAAGTTSSSIMMALGRITAASTTGNQMWDSTLVLVRYVLLLGGACARRLFVVDTMLCCWGRMNWILQVFIAGFLRANGLVNLVCASARRRTKYYTSCTKLDATVCNFRRFTGHLAQPLAVERKRCQMSR